MQKVTVPNTQYSQTDNPSIAKKIRATLAFGLIMSCILVAIIGTTSWKTLNVLDGHIKEAVEESSLKTSLLYDMRIAARERNLHLIMILLAEDAFAVDEQWISFRNQGSKFLEAREDFIALGLDVKEILMLDNQRKLSKEAVVLQYEIYNYIMESDRKSAIKAFNEHLGVQAKVFDALDTLLLLQKTQNKQKLDLTKKTQISGIRTISLLSISVIVIIVLITVYTIQRLSQQAVYIENESLKFKALIEGNMDSVLVLEQDEVTDCNVNALKMFHVNSLNEFNEIGFDYFSGFSETKNDEDNDGVFVAVNHVLVDTTRKYQWEFYDGEGNVFPADVELTGIELEGKSFVQIIIRDVTERERIQKALLNANENLEHKVQERTEELKELNTKIADIARSAGMAEVASGVLHNVGNVLNSVNVSTSLLKDQVRKCKSDKLDKLVELLEENKENLADFLQNDEKGKLVLPFVKQMSKQLSVDQENQLSELNGLSENVDHIKNIISMQQTYTGSMGVVEKLSASMLFEDAIKINIASMSKHKISLNREFIKDLELYVDKHKIIQVLVNLISNAKHAVENNQGDKTIIVGVREEKNKIYFYVKDNGLGIEASDQSRVFEFGFKKREGGHGYGLHHSALVAKEMNGRLSVESKGIGMGALFTLEVPVGA